MKNYFTLWIVVLFFKFAISAILPLIADESYYWIWSLFPQLSYFDHPPMSSWLLWLGQISDFWGSMVRWPSVLLAHSVWLIWYFIFQELEFDLKTIKLWFWLTILSPLMGFGSILVTPDLPLIVFWSLSLLFFIKYLRKPNSMNAFALGSSMGLGFLSKYMIVLFVPLALFTLFKNRHIHRFSLAHTFIVISSGLFFCLPVLIWNYQNSWASFRFQLNHGLHQENFDWRWPVEYSLGQMLALFPVVFWAGIKNNDPRTQILKAFAWGPLVFFLLTSFRAPVEGNWPIMAYPAFYALAVANSWSFRRHWLTVGFWLCLYTFVGIAFLFSKQSLLHGKIQEPFLYRSFSQYVEKYKPLYAINYQLASSLWFQSRQPVYKLKNSSRYDFMDTFAESRPNVNLFYLIKQRHHDLPEWLIKENWQIREVLSLENDHIILEVKK